MAAIIVMVAITRKVVPAAPPPGRPGRGAFFFSGQVKRALQSERVSWLGALLPVLVSRRGTER